MKRLAIVIAAFFVLFAASSCSMLSKVGSSASTSSQEYMNGNTAGVVLSKLATEYVTKGSIDLSNVSNVLNLTTLASSLSPLKSGLNQAIEDFTAGLIAGSKNQITSATSAKVVGALTDLAGNANLDKVTNALQKGKTDLAEVNALKTELEGLVSIFKK